MNCAADDIHLDTGATSLAVSADTFTTPRENRMKWHTAKAHVTC